MIDIETYRCRIGSFSQKVSLGKYLNRVEYFDKSGRRILRVAGISVKIILGVFLLISRLNLPQGGQVDPVHHRVLHVQSSSVRVVYPGVWKDKDSEYLHFVRRGGKKRYF